MAAADRRWLTCPTFRREVGRRNSLETKAVSHLSHLSHLCGASVCARVWGVNIGETGRTGGTRDYGSTG